MPDQGVRFIEDIPEGQFDRFELLGYVKGFAGVWKQTEPTVEKSREIPLENAVVRFPK